MRREAFNGVDDESDADTICVVSIARRVCGPATAQRLVKAFGGTRLHIPKRIDACHPIAEAVGLAEARAISAECFGVSSYVALCPKDRAQRRQALVQFLAADGRSRAQIALAAHVSERAVYRDIAALRARGVVLSSPGNLRRAAAGGAGAADSKES